MHATSHVMKKLRIPSELMDRIIRYRHLRFIASENEAMRVLLTDAVSRAEAQRIPKERTRARPR